MQATSLGFFLGTAVLLGCGRAPSAPEPPTGDLVVATRTTGSDFSPDGYQVFLDREFLQYIGVNDSIIVPSIAARRHPLGLSGLPPNCWGSNELEVTVPPQGTAEARFEFACTTPNTILVTIQTSAGQRERPDSLPAIIYYYGDAGRTTCVFDFCWNPPLNWQGEKITLPGNGSAHHIIQTASAKAVRVALILPVFCRAPSGDFQMADITWNGVVRLFFDVVCD